MSFPIVIDHPSGRTLQLVGASSILTPEDNTVMFIGKKFSHMTGSLAGCKDCLVFVLPDADIPEPVEHLHLIKRVENPRKEFGRFLVEHDAEERKPTEYSLKNGSYISKDATVDKSVVISPFVFIDRDVVVGKGTILHAGVKLLPGTRIGEFCEIHENTVIGTTSIAFEEDQKIPQIGGVLIGNRVSIRALCVIARGSIEDTVIGDDSIIDSQCIVAHNCQIGKKVVCVGGSILFGSVIIGDGSFVSGNVSLKNGVKIGKNSLIGVGSVVLHSFGDNEKVFGNPAKKLISPLG